MASYRAHVALEETRESPGAAAEEPRYYDIFCRIVVEVTDKAVGQLATQYGPTGVRRAGVGHLEHPAQTTHEQDRILGRGSETHDLDSADGAAQRGEVGGEVAPRHPLIKRRPDLVEEVDHIDRLIVLGIDHQCAHPDAGIGAQRGNRTSSVGAVENIRTSPYIEHIRIGLPVQATAIRQRAGAHIIADEKPGKAEVGERITPVQGFIDGGCPDQHAARIDGVEHIGLVELNIGIELEERQAGPRPRGDPELNKGKTQELVRRVPGRLVKVREILSTGVTNRRARVRGLIAIDRDVPAVAPEELRSGELSWG